MSHVCICATRGYRVPAVGAISSRTALDNRARGLEKVPVGTDYVEMDNNNYGNFKCYRSFIDT